MLSTLLAINLLLSGPVDVSIKVDGIERKALVFPAKTNKVAPVVFVFHGFTGNARQASVGLRLHDAWPEATVVYPQGLEVSLLNTKGPGWQIAPGLQQNRDVQFFDALLSKILVDFRGDKKHVYTCGMSNGAIFSYVLLCERSDSFAAAGIVAGYAPPAFRRAKAKPILIVHGKNDPLLGIALAERSRDWAKLNNGVGSDVREWAPGYTQFSAPKGGNEVIWRQHEGGHTWPPGTTDALVKFFKAHAS